MKAKQQAAAAADEFALSPGQVSTPQRLVGTGPGALEAQAVLALPCMYALAGACDTLHAKTN